MGTTNLRNRKAPLEMTPEAFREAGHRLVDEIAAFLESLPGRPVTRDQTPSAVRSLLPSELPEDGAEPTTLLAQTAPLLFDHSLFNGHPRFFGYITASPAPVGALADLLAATVNPNMGGWELSSVASEIEGQCVRWIAELLKMPAKTEGLLVSGGNMANFVCFLAARRSKGGEALREEGLPGDAGRLLVYASTETHTWIQKAADLFGHGTASIRWIPVRRDLTIDTEALLRQIEKDRRQGDRPFLLVGNAGTVSTGAPPASAQGERGGLPLERRRRRDLCPPGLRRELPHGPRGRRSRSRNRSPSRGSDRPRPPAAPTPLSFPSRENAGRAGVRSSVRFLS
jgi:hypothetical protein